MPLIRTVRLARVTALAGAVVVAACGGDGSPDEAADTTAAETSTTEEAPAEPLPVLRPASGDLGTRSLVAGVVSVPDGFLAIGERLSDDAGGGDFQTVTTFWRSTDGRAWTMTDADPSVWGGWTADRLAQGRAGIIVLAGGPDGRAILSSVDGEAWTATPIGADTLGLPADTFTGAFPINDVAAVDDGFLALGQLVTGGQDVEPLLLFSGNGVTWQRAAGPALGPTSAPPEYFAGTAGLDGVTFAFVTSNGGLEVSVWRSTDGLTWEPVGGTDLFGGVDEVIVAAATGFEGRLVVAGHNHTSGAAAVWTSDDGERWSLVPGDGLDGPGSYKPVLFASTTGELVMIGTREPGADGGTTGTVWASSDGDVWRRAQPDDAPVTGLVEMVGAASDGAEVVVVGVEYPGAVDLATVEMNAWWVEGA